MSKLNRNSARHKVFLGVRFSVASDFVQEYAENLSQGGLFVAGAHHLQPLTETTVELELPGAGSFKLLCEVAHVLTPELAATLKRKPGAGMAIKRAPVGFKDALQSYLQRLGRRTDVKVLVANDGLRAWIEKAGYQAGPTPPPEDLAAAIVHSEVPVVAVIVPRKLERVYQQAAVASGAGDIIIPMESEAELADVVRRIDAEL